MRSSEALKERAEIHAASRILLPNDRNKYQLLICNLTQELVELPAHTIVVQTDNLDDNIERNDKNSVQSAELKSTDNLHIDKTQYNSVLLEKEKKRYCKVLETF